MVLALDYMQQTGTADAALKERALGFIDKGYHRLLGFEVKSEPGGFDWWGNPPANLFLSAYGLMEFLDMAAVYPVEPALLARIVKYLEKHQAEDGSWTLAGKREPWSITWKKSAFNMTAYITWALARAGHDTTKARAWLDAHTDVVEDPYGLALAALAHRTADPKSKRARTLADLVVQMKQEDEDGVFWTAAEKTFVGGRGVTAHIETTALVALLLLDDPRHEMLGFDTVDRIAKWRGQDGRFGSTHSTILALRALIHAAKTGGGVGAKTLRVRTSDGAERVVPVPPDSTEAVRVELGRVDPQDLRFLLEGKGRLRSTLSRTTWEDWPTTKMPRGPLRLAVSWPDGVLPVGEVAEARASVKHGGTDTAGMVIVEIGIPPGCDVEPEDVKGPGIAEAEKSETAIVLYLEDLQPGDTRRFTVPFRPRFQIDVRTAPSRVYEYYVEHEMTVVPPVRVRAR